MRNDKICTVRNGVEIPWIAFGNGVIWKYTRNAKLFLKASIYECLSSLKHLKWNRELYGNLYGKAILCNAYDAGFRMFDTGRIYAHSEDRIGKTVSSKRGTYIVTKCSAMDVTRETITPKKRTVEDVLNTSLQNLQRESVDVYLLHWPEGDWVNYYSQIIEQYNKGKCRAFGACNMEVEHLKKLQAAGLELPMVIQTEIHPFNTKTELRDFCMSNGIQLMAHTPTARASRELADNPEIQKMVKKYNKTAVQITIRWHYQNGIIPVVSTFSKIHQEEDLNIFDFELSEKEMESIERLNKDLRLLDSHGIDDPNYIYNY